MVAVVVVVAVVIVVVVVVVVAVVYSWEVNRDKKFMDISRWTVQGTPLPHQGNDVPAFTIQPPGSLDLSSYISTDPINGGFLSHGCTSNYHPFFLNKMFHDFPSSKLGVSSFMIFYGTHMELFHRSWDHDGITKVKQPRLRQI